MAIVSNQLKFAQRVTGELHLQLKYFSKNGLFNSVANTSSSSMDIELTPSFGTDVWQTESQYSLPDAFSVERMIKDIHSARYLHSFMKEELCEENLEFIYAVNQYKKVYYNRLKMSRNENPSSGFISILSRPMLENDRFHDLSKMASAIYERFLKTDSVQEVNITWDLRDFFHDVFERKIQETPMLSSVLTVDVFDLAHYQILNIIQSDVFQRFFYSTQFTKWSDSLEWSVKFSTMEEKRKKQSLTYLIESMDESSLQFLKKRIAQREKNSGFLKSGGKSVITEEEYCSDEEEGVFHELNLIDFCTSKYVSRDIKPQVTPSNLPNSTVQLDIPCVETCVDKSAIICSTESNGNTPSTPQSTVSPRSRRLSTKIVDKMKVFEHETTLN